MIGRGISPAGTGAGVADAPAPAASDGGPDAELVRVCRQFAEAELEDWYRYVTSPDDVADAEDAPADFATVRWITATPATTVEGFRAKALVYTAWDTTALDTAPEYSDSTTALLQALLCDMVAAERKAILAGLAAKYGPLPRGYTPEGIWVGNNTESPPDASKPLPPGMETEEESVVRGKWPRSLFPPGQHPREAAFRAAGAKLAGAGKAISPAAGQAAPDGGGSMMGIMQIASELADLETAHNRFDKLSSSAEATDRGGEAAQVAADLVDDRAEALQRLLDTIPAACLAEAAVQLRQAARLAQGLHAMDLAPAHSPEIGARIERLLLSALPHAAAAAGLDPEALGWGPVFRLRARRFGALLGEVA